MTRPSPKLLLLALIYASSYHFAYKNYLHPVFGYADFRYEPSTFLYTAWTYFAAISPIFAFRRSNAPAATGCALIYTLSYVPIQLTLTFIWTEKNLELFFLQLSVAISMTVLLRTASQLNSTFPKADAIKKVFFEPNGTTLLIHTLTLASLFILILEYRSSMRLVSFADVYNLREEAREIRTTAVTGYVTLWLTYCFGPFYLARALIRKKITDWTAGLLIFLLIYMATGSKLALLTPIIMIGLQILGINSKDFLKNILFLLNSSIAALVILIPTEGPLRWVNAIIFGRILGSNGWTGAVYYEYFSNSGYTFYTHIGPVNSILNLYPYHDHSLGQEIAKAYFNSDAANFNAGFWASDGFAALGIAGVFIITLFMLIFFKILNASSRKSFTPLINLWLVGFWMALMNAPLTTALLSCGGLLVLMLTLTSRLKIFGTKFCLKPKIVRPPAPANIA